MKRIIKVTTVIALLLSTTLSMAKDSEIRLIASKEAKSLVLTLDKTAKNLTLTFTDTNENILYFEKMENGTLTKKFNLHSLENGKYYLTTSDASRLVVYTVSIAEKSVNIIEKKETLKPYFRKTKDKIFVNFLNLDKSKVDIKVYDEEYRVVFSETVTEEMIIEKAFNFQDAYAGNYRVVVLDSKKSYSENFIVD
ncbi:hypothetical protein [Maribacter antarcticus]|uniref:hypothetical protein n=1 Tax=Maribacter antarcticus TaxID=505250 RepID=UPI000687F077|nr:hypothetical protein [Maribacter antarcticus]